LIDSIKAGSEEERQKIERRRRAEETISGIADMGKALSNLYFTGKGAPNMYDPKTAMTPKARERYERALKNWEKNRAASMQYALNKQSADLKQQANDLAQRKLDEQERHNKAVEGRQQLEYELRAAKQRWNEDFQDRKLSQQDKIAQMNADIRRMSVITGMKKSQIAHQLAGYEIHKEKWKDPTTGNVHERTTRTVVNPQTGELEAKTTEEVRQGSSTTNGTTTTTAQHGSGKAPNGWNSSSNSTTNKSNKSGRSPQGW
jgi:ribosome-binding ATPase YchF (GTP1/OBG family)